MTPRFRWTCSYMGMVEYEISDETGTYRAEIQQSVCDHALRTANGDDVRRDLLASVGIIRRSHASDEEHRAWRNNPQAPIYGLPQSTVDAFNSWRLAEHLAQIASMESQPHRYGIIAPDDRARIPPMVASVGHYICGSGWIAEVEALAA